MNYRGCKKCGGKMKMQAGGGMPPRQQDFPDLESWMAAMDAWMSDKKSPPTIDFKADVDRIGEFNVERPEDTSPAAPVLDRIQEGIQKGIIDGPKDRDAMDYYKSVNSYNPKEKKAPFKSYMNPGLVMQSIRLGLGLFAGAQERGRQNQMDYKNQTALGNIEPMPVQDFQPNPFSLYAKYGGNLKTIIKDYNKWTNQAEMDMGAGKNGKGKMQAGGPLKIIPQSTIDKTAVFNPRLLSNLHNSKLDVERTKDDKAAKDFLNEYYNWAIQNQPYYRDLSTVDSASARVNRPDGKFRDENIKRLQNEISKDGYNAEKYDTLFYMYGQGANMIDDPSLRKKAEKEDSVLYDNYRRKILTNLNSKDSALKFYPRSFVRNENGLLGEYDNKNNITSISEYERLGTLVHERAHKADRDIGFDKQLQEEKLLLSDHSSKKIDPSLEAKQQYEYLMNTSERQARHRSTQFWLKNNYPNFDITKPIDSKHYEFLKKNEKDLPGDVKQIMGLYGDESGFTKYINRFKRGGSTMKKGGYEIDRMVITRKILPQLLLFGRLGTGKYRKMQIGGLAGKMRNQYMSGVNPSNTEKLARLNPEPAVMRTPQETVGPAKKRTPQEQLEANKRRAAANYAYAMVNPQVKVDEYGDLHPNQSEYTEAGKLWKGVKHVGEGLLDATIVMDAPRLAYNLGKAGVKKFLTKAPTMGVDELGMYTKQGDKQIYNLGEGFGDIQPLPKTTRSFPSNQELAIQKMRTRLHYGKQRIPTAENFYNAEEVMMNKRINSAFSERLKNIDKDLSVEERLDALNDIRKQANSEVLNSNEFFQDDVRRFVKKRKATGWQENFYKSKGLKTDTKSLNMQGYFGMADDYVNQTGSRFSVHYDKAPINFKERILKKEMLNIRPQTKIGWESPAMQDYRKQLPEALKQLNLEEYKLKGALPELTANKYGGKIMRKGGLTPNKAREILHDGTAQGKPLTDKQRRYFGAMSKGHTNYRGK